MKDEGLALEKKDEEGAKRAPWVPPVVNRIRAGSAEFGDVSRADAQPGFS
jgi:hypothetical protein